VSSYGIGLCIRWGPDSPWDGAILKWDGGVPMVRYRDSVVIWEKADEPIEMSFGMLRRLDPRNHVLAGVQIAYGKWQF